MMIIGERPARWPTCRHHLPGGQHPMNTRTLPNLILVPALIMILLKEPRAASCP